MPLFSHFKHNRNNLKNKISFSSYPFSEKSCVGIVSRSFRVCTFVKPSEAMTLNDTTVKCKLRLNILH